jgi:hypothetical protein
MNPTRYTFIGHPVPAERVADLPDHMTLFDAVYGTHVVRRRTEQYVGVPRPRAAAA